MCGIAGFFNLKRNPETFSRLISEMLSMISHRGPDEMGYYFDNKIALGSARLSVVDLLSGKQPISDLTERYWITYNGEVYNYIELKEELEKLGYKFSTKSDTEVVLNSYIEWGVDSFKKLNGGFAFVIYDRFEDSIILVRDRYGERPLYYTKNGNEFIFSSEIKCFLCLDEIKLEFDVEQLRSIFTIWTSLPNQTAYKNVFQVPTGGYIKVKNGHVYEEKKYYSFTFPNEKFTGTEKEAIEKTKHELSESIRIRLRSDVEVGTYLSGGLDSSITTFLATKLSNHTVKTFSVTFEDKTFDESTYQNEVSNYLDTKHKSLHISNDDITNNFLFALWHGEVPVFRTAFVPMFLLSKMVQDSKIKVVLTGEGSDEFFLGYDLFKEALLRSVWNKISDEEKGEMLSNLHPSEPIYQNNLQKFKIFYGETTQEKSYGLFSHEIRYSASSFATRLLSSTGDGLEVIRNYIEANKSEFNTLSALERTQWLESKTLLSGYLLSTQGDRMSFSHGVESRLPFLDPNVVNWASSLPINLKLKDRTNEKYILKKAFENDLPKSILAKPKYAYRSPDTCAFLHTNNPPDYLSLILSEGELKSLGFINVDFALKLVNKLKSTPKDKISHRENHAFIFLLSTVLLQRHLLKTPLKKPNIELVKKLLVKKIDGRTLATAA